MIYHLFSFSDYYPCGGMADFIKSFATLEEAKAAMPGNGFPDEANIAMSTPEGLKRVADWTRREGWTDAV